MHNASQPHCVPQVKPMFWQVGMARRARNLEQRAPTLKTASMTMITELGSFMGKHRSTEHGGHLKPVTLKPVSRILRFSVFRISAFSAFGHLLRPLFFWGERDLPHLPRIGIEPLISKIRPTGFTTTGLSQKFRKGVGGQRGLARRNLSYARD